MSSDPTNATTSASSGTFSSSTLTPGGPAVCGSSDASASAMAPSLGLYAGLEGAGAAAVETHPALDVRPGERWNSQLEMLDLPPANGTARGRWR